ncbi:hypothetical protein G6F42_028945 [Rhizopus arrhizus]|nr:hypothetical protein G6F42_028945 [Rhizopus arrhizus]
MDPNPSNGSPCKLLPTTKPLLVSTTTPTTEMTMAVNTLTTVNTSCTRIPARTESALINVNINKQITASNFGKNGGITESASSTEASES